MQHNAAEPDAHAVNVIKALIMDMTRKAGSGHPGGAMSSADMAYIVFKDFLQFHPADPDWFNRDRFVLSAGHESALLYALLACTGLLCLEDLKNFRQAGSLTPGHPEHDMTPGVEATTGPLGQGIAMGVGMAVAETMLRARLTERICSHFTYVLASDGDMQEPVALGAASLAGHWKLGKLIVLYDKNKVQLAGNTAVCDSTDYPGLFQALGWQVITIDGHDHTAITEALRTAQQETTRPTLIIGHTTMAKGAATLEGDYTTHGAPLSPEEIAATKEQWGLDPKQEFVLPENTLQHFRSTFPSQQARAEKWKRGLLTRLDNEEDFATLWQTLHTPRPELTLTMPVFSPGDAMATRTAWGKVLDTLQEQLPLLTGGSADLDPSNQTVRFREAVGIFSADNPAGRNLCFGVREFPMAAIINGMQLHGSVIPFGATFLTFADYERNAIRLSALQKLPVLHVFTHDSFYVGEDGPTHQPVEHIASLRLIPNLLVLRPADANETALCLDIALTQQDRPSCLLLTRQNLPVLDPQLYPALKQGPRQGGYILADCENEPEIILIATGSEVRLALETASLLDTPQVRVVSMPCMELFDEQSTKYKQTVLPPDVFKVAVEAGRTDILYKYTGTQGLVFGLDHFGASAPADELEKQYGFTAASLAARIAKVRGK